MRSSKTSRAGRFAVAGWVFILFVGFTATVMADDDDDETQVWTEQIDLAKIFTTERMWTSYTEWAYHGGNQRSLVDGNWMVPLLQDQQSLLFADIRGRWDDNQSLEGNWGMAYRRIFEGSSQDWIVGGYSYYDLARTRNHNSFSQVTVGMEAMTYAQEVRANGYIPITTDSKGMATATGGAQLVGNSIFLFGGLERSYYGVDAEVGQLLTYWNKGKYELRGFAGGYYFNTADSNFPNVSGPRMRLEFRSYDLSFFGPGSRLTVGVDYQWDQVRHDQVIGVVSVRIPLGRTTQPPNLLERRMLDRIVRDVDIVSVDSHGVDPAVDPVSGHQLTNMTVIDAYTANAQNAVTAAGANSSVFVDGSKGPVAINNSITTQPGQLIFGRGVELHGQIGGERAYFGGDTSVINNSNSGADSIVMSIDSVLRSLEINGGKDGVTTSGSPLSQNSAVVNVHVIGAAANGFNFGDINGRVLNNIAESNGGVGFAMNEIKSGAVVENNVASGNTSVGYSVGDISGQFANNAAVGNQSAGFLFNDLKTGSSVTGNVALQNGDEGFHFNDIQAGANFSSNISLQNTVNGINVRDVFGTFTNNVSDINGHAGFVFRNLGNGAVVSDNTAQANAVQGFILQDVLAGSVFTRNQAQGNGGLGFLFNDISGSVTDNTSTSNLDSGFVFHSVLTGGVFSDNVAKFNSQDGVLFTSIFGGDVFNNVSATNGGHGYSPSGTIISGNVYNNTGSGNAAGYNTLP